MWPNIRIIKASLCGLNDLTLKHMKTLFTIFILFLAITAVGANNVSYFEHDEDVYQQFQNMDELENYVEMNPGVTFKEIVELGEFNAVIDHKAFSSEKKIPYYWNPFYWSSGSTACYSIGSALGTIVVAVIYLYLILEW